MMYNSIQILLVEDDEVDVLAFVRALKKTELNHLLTFCQTAQDALELAEKQAFDVIFLDYQLPGQDGLKLLKEFRSRGFDAPIAIITGQGDEKIAVEAMKNGAFDYFAKSEINPQTLTAVVRSALKFKVLETERIRTQKALIESEKDNREIVQYCQAIIMTHDMSGFMLSANPATSESLGDKNSSLSGKNLREYIPPGEKQAFDDYLLRISNTNVVSGVLKLRTKKGKEIYWLYKNIKKEDNETGKHVICYAQDITERIHMENELKAAKEKALDSVKFKEQFLASMSHEIRTPLNTILGFTDLLIETKLDPQQKEYVELVNTSGQNLLVIINDILDLSKIEAGKMTFESIDFNLPQMLQKLRDMFMPKATSKQLKLGFYPSESLPEFVKGDPTRLFQIFNNLLSNSLKFTEKGEVSISAEVLVRDDETAKIEFLVSDTGIGIPEDKLDSIFESFTQAAEDTTRKFGGTGLGLTIVKKLIELQGGEISVISRVGAGSTFRVTLPMKFGERSELPKQKAEKTDYKLGKVKVLIAEDNKINQLLAKKVLDNWNFESEIAENGKEAIEKLSSKYFDIVLMDIQMPEMDGYETTDYIRNKMKPPFREIPILAMTAHAAASEAKACIDAGMNDYISKPFDSQELYNKIAKQIQKKRN
jgi:PAS domain S-box-containing protein